MTLFVQRDLPQPNGALTDHGVGDALLYQHAEDPAAPPEPRRMLTKEWTPPAFPTVWCRLIPETAADTTGEGMKALEAYIDPVLPRSLMAVDLARAPAWGMGHPIRDVRGNSHLAVDSYKAFVRIAPYTAPHIENDGRLCVPINMKMTSIDFGLVDRRMLPIGPDGQRYVILGADFLSQIVTIFSPGWLFVGGAHEPRYI